MIYNNKKKKKQIKQKVSQLHLGPVAANYLWPLKLTLMCFLWNSWLDETFFKILDLADNADRMERGRCK